MLHSNQSVYRQIASQSREGWCCQWGRPVVRNGNRVQDSCNRLNWGALNYMHFMHFSYNYHLH